MSAVTMTFEVIDLPKKMYHIEENEGGSAFTKIMTTLTQFKLALVITLSITVFNAIGIMLADYVISLRLDQRSVPSLWQIPLTIDGILIQLNHYTRDGALYFIWFMITGEEFTFVGA